MEVDFDLMMATIVMDRVELEGAYVEQAQELARTRAALQGLYDILPRYSCKSNEPDDCPVCVARAILKRGPG